MKSIRPPRSSRVQQTSARAISMALLLVAAMLFRRCRSGALELFFAATANKTEGEQ